VRCDGRCEGAHLEVLGVGDVEDAHVARVVDVEPRRRNRAHEKTLRVVIGGRGGVRARR